MKDYYYFLGVSREATADEIRKAYRKLSLKYHPDRNNNDAFFANRFREIQEAYDVLGNEQGRKGYDASFAGAQQTFRSNLPPYIKTFSSNKIRVRKGEEIILTWQTNNADLVKILPFGLEKAYGERTFKITEFKDGQFHVVLQATNTLINKSVVQGITIKEVFENQQDTDEGKTPEFIHKNPAEISAPRLNLKLVAITIITFLAIILIYLLYKN